MNTRKFILLSTLISVLSLLSCKFESNTSPNTNVEEKRTSSVVKVTALSKLYSIEIDTLALPLRNTLDDEDIKNDSTLMIEYSDEDREGHITMDISSYQEKKENYVDIKDITAYYVQYLLGKSENYEFISKENLKINNMDALKVVFKNKEEIIDGDTKKEKEGTVRYIVVVYSGAKHKDYYYVLSFVIVNYSDYVRYKSEFDKIINSLNEIKKFETVPIK